jgi:hypothetical protein
MIDGSTQVLHCSAKHLLEVLSTTNIFVLYSAIMSIEDLSTWPQYATIDPEF